MYQPARVRLSYRWRPEGSSRAAARRSPPLRVARLLSPSEVVASAWGRSVSIIPRPRRLREGDRKGEQRAMMPKRDFMEMTWTEIAKGDVERWIAVLSVAAVE